jgi:DNA-binding response OmpR family regulator
MNLIRKKLLLVEDEDNLSASLLQFLTKESYEVSLAKTLSEARHKVKDQPELVILDWMLPDGEGVELLKEWRKADLALPVILLTARAEVIDKVLGLELGANDYLTKPFEPRELLARIRVQIRNLAVQSVVSKPTALLSQIVYRDLYMNLQNREVKFRNASVALTKMEFELLKLFMENPNQVFSRDELLNRVWGYDQFPTTRTVDMHVLQLRQKISEELFETVRGIGYRMK